MENSEQNRELAELRSKIAALDELRRSTGHDIRAPLRAIRSAAAILGEDLGAQLSNEHRDLLNRVNENARRLEEIIDQLLLACRQLHAASPTDDRPG